MEIEIREIEIEDYKELLDFMRKVKAETNFLLGYPDEIKLSYEDEKERIKKVKSSETSNYFVVMKNSKSMIMIIHWPNMLPNTPHIKE